MAWPSFAYDDWYTLEDNTGWTETNPNTNISYSASGMTINVIGGTAGADAAYLRRALGHDHISLGFQITIPSIGSGDTGVCTFFCMNDSTSYDSNKVIQLQYYHPSGGTVHNIMMKNASGDSSYLVFPAGGANLWIALDLVRNATSTMRVCDFVTHEQIGSDITHTGGNNAGTYLWIGNLAAPAPAANQNYIYHNLVIDSTDYTFPLPGWSTDTSIDVSADLEAVYGQMKTLEVLEGGHWIEHRTTKLIF